MLLLVREKIQKISFHTRVFKTLLTHTFSQANDSGEDGKLIVTAISSYHLLQLLPEFNMHLDLLPAQLIEPEAIQPWMPRLFTQLVPPMMDEEV